MLFRSERTRKQVIRSKTLPATTGHNQSASAGSPALAIGSSSTSTSPTVDPTHSTGSASVSAPPIAEGRRVPEGAIDAPPSIRGKYAKAGATQRGWSLYVGARFLHCYFAPQSGSDMCTNAYIFRRQSSSCPFLATSANGQVPFAPVWRASGVDVAVRFENPVHTAHSLGHQSPNRIPLTQDSCRRFRVLLPRRALCDCMLGKSRMKHRTDYRKIVGQSATGLH